MQPLPALTAPSATAADIWAMICTKLQIRTDPSDPEVERVDRLIAAEFAAELAGDEFRAFIEELKTDVEAWGGGKYRATALGISDIAETAVIALAGEWRSSDGYFRRYGRAFQLAAADAFDLAVPPGTLSGVGEAARQLVDRYPALWNRIINLQYARTAALLGSSIVVAHRGNSHPTPAQQGSVDPKLRPVSSFSLDAGIALHFPMNDSSCVTLVQHAQIPVERILATPATGFAALLEKEIVVLGPSEGNTDLVRQT
jgi:hypothetical protein